MNYEENVPNESLIRARHEKGWSQAQLAFEVGTTFETVSRWERGVVMPGPYNSEKLCSALGKTARELGFDKADSVPLPSGDASRCIFISSAYADSEHRFVVVLKKELALRDITLWSSRMVKRQSLHRKSVVLQEAIRAAQLVLVILSPHTKGSTHVGYTRDLARHFKRPVCEVWIEGESLQECLPENYGEPGMVIDAHMGEEQSLRNQVITTMERIWLTPGDLETVELSEPMWNVPEPSKPLIGREELLEKVCTLLRGPYTRLLTLTGPPPSLKARRYQPWEMIPDPAERRLAVIRLHSEGWSITSIAEYLETSRPTIYTTLQRWAEEGVAGLEEKSKARKGPRKVTLAVRNEIRKLQQNPLLGEYRVHTALLRMGINVSPATCGRILAANRHLYGIENPKHQPRAKLEMPFRATRRHEFWSIDVRYIEEHLLENPKPVYVITVFENFSRMVLSSAISPTQNQWDYLSVLADALRRYGAPEAIVTDGGGIFYSNQAMQLYDMLGILKERIEPGEPWQDYAETLFSIQRRLADHAFSNARTWPEIQQAHQTWWTNYNSEHHYAHRTRQDERHSPFEVLRGMLGRTYPEEVLSRVLYTTQFTRHLDKHGYIRFKHWRFFGENGLAGSEVSVWVYEGTLKIEYQATALSLYSVRLSPDQQITGVKNPRRIETHFRSPQLDLWQLSDTEWLLALRRPEPGVRRKRSKLVALARQLPLPDFGATG